MKATTLVQRYGSPLYVYDLTAADRSAAALRRELPDGSILFYSLKANPHPEVVRALRAAGCRAEISSTGELDAALLAGHAPADCLYTGPGKTAAELAHAFDRGVTLFSAESPGDLDRIGTAAGAHGVTARCLLRINGTTGAGSAGLRMTGTASQFGFDLETAADWTKRIADAEHVEPVGLHLFSLTNAGDEDSLLRELLANVRTAARLRDTYGTPVRLLDLGGGFAHPYAVPGTRPAYPRLRSALEEALDRDFPTWRTGDVEIAFESGRHLGGACGRLLTTVTDVKESRGRTFVVLDAGVNTLGGLAGLRRLPPVRAVPVSPDDADGSAVSADFDVSTASDGPTDPDGPTASATPADTPRPLSLVGPLCTPSDTLAHDIPLPLPRPGDLLAVPNTGAYGLSASLLAFLSRPAPAEVAVRDGRVVSATVLELVRTPAGRPAGPSPADRARAVLPVLAAHAAHVDAEARFPVESLDALRDSGLMGLLVPVDRGGLGGGLADLVEVAQLLASACLSTAMIWAMHCQQVDVLVRHGAPELLDDLLPRIAQGRTHLGSITSEKQTGGHLFTSAAPLRETPDGLLVERDAPIVTGGAFADGFLVTMRDTEEASARRVTLVYVAREQADVEVGGGWNPLGMRGTHSVALRLTALVPEHHVIGVRGEFAAVATAGLIPLGHIGWAACWLGAARAAVSGLVAVLRSPRRPGSIDLTSDLVAERIATLRTDLELVRAYLDLAQREITEIRATGADPAAAPVQIHLNTLKVTAARLCHQVADRCVQLAGLGLGYRADSPLPLERHLRDLRSASLNYADDRLLTATGTLCLADRAVRLLGDAPSG
ncbi:acyl-CoA dehydrogenase family protein [Streptomyces sp. NPDC087908]|uniref:acyl-CoA dehydrogenase family protein n=1 Tax=Streptomyces sp. NPDC087908 TaxID=3365820 RepID=UPI00380B9C2B